MEKAKNTILSLVVVTLPLFFACGGGGGGGGGGTGQIVSAVTEAGASEVDLQRDCANAVPLPADLEPTWNETAQCTALAATPPRVIFSATVRCPRSGEMQCLADVPFFPCSDDPAQTCGAIGRFLPSCDAVELPDQYQGGAAHEMIHYLLRQAGHSDWAGHAGPEWVCQ